MQGQDEIIAKIAAIRKAQDELSGKQTALRAADKAGNVEAGKTYEKNRIQIKEYGAEINALSKTVAVNAKANKEQTGSLNDMRMQLKKMTLEYDNLSREQRENTDVGRNMQLSINALSKDLATAEGATGRFQRKVGDYQSAVDTANKSIREMQLELRDLRSVPLDNLSPGEIAQVEQNMGRLTDAIGDANARIRVQAMDDIPALVASLQGVVAASQLVVGSMALFGVQDERVEKLTQTMIQLVGVSQALATVSELVTSGQAKDLAIKTKDIAVSWAKTVATAAQTAATKTLAGAQALLNKVMKAFPLWAIVAAVMALVAGIVLLIRNFDKVTAAFRNFGEKLGLVKKQTETVVDANAALLKSNEKLIEQSQRRQGMLDFEIKLLKALGANSDTIAKKQREMLELKVQEATLTAQNAKNQVLAGEITREAYQEMLDAIRYARREVILFDAEQTKIANDRQKQSDKDAQAERERRQKAADERRAAAEAQRQADEKEIRDKALRDEKAALDLAVLEAKTDEDRMNARIARIRRESELELENKRLTDNEKLLIQAETFVKEQELRNQFAEKQLEQERINQAERQRITDQETERNQAQKQFEQEMTNARMESAEAFTDLLSVVGEDQAEFAKAVKVAQKGLALVEIAINLQRELSAIRVAARLKDAVLPGSGLVMEGIQSARAVVQAAASAAKIIAMNRGGSVPGTGNTDTVPAMLTPGEGVLRQQAMTARENWSLSGTPKQIASTLNQAYGGVEFKNRGGLAGGGLGSVRSATRNANAAIDQQTMMEAFKKIRIVTTIEDINNGVSSEAVRNQIASYFG